MHSRDMLPTTSQSTKSLNIKASKISLGNIKASKISLGNIKASKISLGNVRDSTIKIKRSFDSRSQLTKVKNSKTKLSSKHVINLPVLLPEDETKAQANRPDLLEDLVSSMNDLFGVQDHLVRIEGEGDDANLPEEQQEQNDDEEHDVLEHVAKSAILIIQKEDTNKEDFFDPQEDEKFGAISGMTDGDEDEMDVFHRMRAEDLSQNAAKFVADLDGPDGLNSALILQVSATSDIHSDSSIRESIVSIQSRVGTEAQMDTAAQLKEDESSKRIRPSKITISVHQMPSRVLPSVHQMPSRVLPSVSIITSEFTKPTVEEEAMRNMNLRRRTLDSAKRKLTIPGLDTRVSIMLSHKEDNRRESVLSGPRRSIYSGMDNRLSDSESDLMEFLELETDKFILPDYDDFEVEEEEIISVVEEEVPALDREPYYSRYDDITDTLMERRMKNNILQKKVTMYLKRRQIKNFIKDSEFPLDQLIKYNRILDTYQEVMEVSSVQWKTVNEELNSLKEKRQHYCIILDKVFKAMQNRENNIGTGLIFSKTGAVISDKLIERLLKRQKIQTDQVATMRLKYIKLKGMVQEKLDNIEQKNKLEDNLYLADYEQLKAENRSYADKIEEREEDLTRVRAKCQNTIQILAHLREKSSALESDVEILKEDLEFLEMSADDNRGNLADLKNQRDKYRNRIVKMKTESGLLTQPVLLADMEEAQEELSYLTDELKRCQELVNERKTQIRNLRKNIEKHTEIVSKRKMLKSKLSHATLTTLSVRSRISINATNMLGCEDTIYRNRPTIHMPIVHPDAFKDLVKVKPNPITQTRKRR